VSTPYQILEALRAGRPLTGADLAEVVRGAAQGGWGDAQLGAFLMGVAVRGLPPERVGDLTRAMLESGEQWHLGRDIPHLGDKHSTGGVGDKVSLVLGPLLASCGVPVVMMTGRGLGHTAGTADKLETMPGFRQALERDEALRLIEATGLALLVPTARVAPADRRLYALRDVTATVRSLPLVVASILSKKLAAGAVGLVLDVKTGSGAFFPDLEDSRALARALVATARELGMPARALVTDMSQPLGRWSGHAVEVEESLATLENRGPADLTELTLVQAEELSQLVGLPLERSVLEDALASGRARRQFDRWAEGQGVEPSWLARPTFPRAERESVALAPRAGTLAAVDTERLGLLLAEAGGGRVQPGDAIDLGVALRSEARLGDEVTAGQPLARLYTRSGGPDWVTRLGECFSVGEEGEAVPLVYERVG
jgi:pyrimidine-nucleoside phosphorylase/thymidine phosphorylase